MFAPQNKYSTPSTIGDDWLRLVRSHSQFCETDEPEKTGVVFGIPAGRGLYHGIGLGPGTGAASQIADAQGGSGGVGISNSLPWVAADPPLMHIPVKVSMLG